MHAPLGIFVFPNMTAAALPQSVTVSVPNEHRVAGNNWIQYDYTNYYQWFKFILPLTGRSHLPTGTAKPSVSAAIVVVYCGFYPS